MSVPTEQLLRRIREGESAARQALYERCLPLLTRWAHGRMPAPARDIADTDDLVQVTLLRALNHLEEFQANGSGSFLAYLRQILLNEVRAELRRRQRGVTKVDIETQVLADDSSSVVERLVGHERLLAYEKALAALDRRDQELIVMRLEFGDGELIGATFPRAVVSSLRSTWRTADGGFCYWARGGKSG